MPTEPQLRRRLLTYRQDNAEQRVDIQYIHDRTVYPTRKIVGEQVTVSEGHPWTSSKKFKGKDLGGAFRTTKQTYSDNLGTNQVFTDKNGVEKPGNSRVFDIWSVDPRYQDYYSRQVRAFSPIYPVEPLSSRFPPTLESSTEELIAKGTQAIARCKPTNSVANLSTALGELRKDGLPSIPGSQVWKDRARKSLKNSGSEYLNVQFGWLPLVRDIQDVAKAVRKSDEILEQYRRDAGKLVRRRYEFPSIDDVVKTETFTGQNPFYDGIDSYHFNPATGRQSVITKTRTVSRKQWFSGAFTYHIPVGNSQAANLARHALEAKKLLGLTLTPKVLWDLTPWSWAVDWFVNVGDILDNVTDSVTDGLVMPFGYMMEHTIVTDTYTLQNHCLKAVSPAITFTSSFKTETKKRVQATPYGFGITWDEFSPFQLSIMAALGLSRNGKR